MHIRLVTGTDGKVGPCRALQVLVHSLEQVGVLRQLGRPDVLCPQGSEELLQSELGWAADICRVRAPKCALPERDPYGLKFLLGVREWLEEGDAEGLLYLDYDHVAHSMPPLPVLRDGEVWISSQQDLLSELGDIAWPAGMVEALGGIHPNTSLLFLTRDTMIACAPEWRSCYERLIGIVGPRWREEIAFGWAVSRSGCQLRQVDPSVQASWDQAAIDCALFHYGGESKAARLLKDEVLTAQNWGPGDVALLRDHALERIEERRVRDVAIALFEVRARARVVRDG